MGAIHRSSNWQRMSTQTQMLTLSICSMSMDTNSGKSAVIHCESEPNCHSHIISLVPCICSLHTCCSKFNIPPKLLLTCLLRKNAFRLQVTNKWYKLILCDISAQISQQANPRRGSLLQDLDHPVTRMMQVTDHQYLHTKTIPTRKALMPSMFTGKEGCQK